MDTETEKKSNDDIKVIAIKLGYDLQERLLSFPLLHALRERYPTSDFHFITPQKNIEILNLLPFSAYYHEYAEDDLKSIFDIHPFCANLKIYNVDLFISLTNSFVDACLGLGLRAKKRLGFSDGWKTLLFNQKNPRPQNQHLTEDFYSLYKTHVNANVDIKIKIMSRELASNIGVWDTQPYVAINLSPLRDLEIDESFIELINKFENQRIVLFSSDDQPKTQLMMESFIARLSPKNQYINYIFKSWIDLAKMMAFAKGIITFNGPLASLSAYVGSKTFIMYDSEDPQRFGPFYFLADVMIVGGNDPTVMNKNISDKVIKDRVRFNMEEVASRAFNFFRL